MDGTIRSRQALCAAALWAGALLATPMAAASGDEINDLRSLSVSAVVRSRCEISRPELGVALRVDCARGASAHRIQFDVPNPDGVAPPSDAADTMEQIVEVTF